jgi:hypothetical protein
MKLQSVGPPERGSLSVVYSCPECGYEMAMLTNAYETQVVQSLGVRIGPALSGVKGRAVEGPALSTVEGPALSAVEGPQAEAGAAVGGKCPFSAMIPGNDGAADRSTGEPTSVRWTAAAEARLANIPEFVRPMARTGIEKFAQERGAREVDEQILDAARDFFGM